MSFRSEAPEWPCRQHSDSKDSNDMKAWNCCLFSHLDLMALSSRFDLRGPPEAIHSETRTSYKACSAARRCPWPDKARQHLGRKPNGHALWTYIIVGVLLCGGAAEMFRNKTALNDRVCAVFTYTCHPLHTGGHHDHEGRLVIRFLAG